MALSFFQKISRAITGKSRVDDDTLDAIEEALIESDMGVDTTLKVVDALEDRVSRDKYTSFDELVSYLRDEISALLQKGGNSVESLEAHKPYVILVVGVNGVGKTTTIGKLAHLYKSRGKKVILGAADTFRAAAVDQLEIWAQRAGVDIVRQAMGSDPASVAYDTVKAAVARGADVAIIDTAGRLHNKKNLMEELRKINRVIDRELPDCLRETLIVLDGTTGQNALEQAREFKDVCEISGIVLTKLDGTARGGIAVAIQAELQIPVKYIGVGEKIDDLRKFDSAEFVDALFTRPEEEE